MIGDLDEVQWAYLLDPTFELVNTAGKPLTDGWIEVYIHGTRSKYYCAKDFDGTLHEFKIPLDSLGANIILASPAHAYDVYVYNKFGSLIMSRYNVVPATGDGAVIKDVVNITSKDGTVGVTTSNQTDWDLSIKDTVDRVEANTTEIGQIKVDVANTKTDLTNLTEVVNGHTTEIGQIKDDVAGIESSLTNKKDKQTANTFTGSATKTIKNISQNANGELTVEFADIDLPQEVPNVEITSPNGTIDVQSSTDVQTNTKTFTIDVNKGAVPYAISNGSITFTPGSYYTDGKVSLSNIKSSGIEYANNKDGWVLKKDHVYVIAYNIIASTQAQSNELVGGRIWLDGFIESDQVWKFVLDSSYSHDESLTGTAIVCTNQYGEVHLNMRYDSNSLSSIPLASVNKVEIADITSIVGQGGSGTTYSAGYAIDLTNDTISVKYGKGLEITTDNKLQLKVGKGLTLDNDTLEVTIDNAVGEVVDTVEKLQSDLDKKITTTYPFAQITTMSDFAVYGVTNTSRMIGQLFAVPIASEIRKDETLLCVNALQNFSGNVSFGIFEYDFAANNGTGSTYWIADTGTVSIQSGENKFKLKNVKNATYELKSSMLYYAVVAIAGNAPASGLMLGSSPAYSQNVNANPKYTIIVSNMDQAIDWTTGTLQGAYFQGYNEQYDIPRLFMMLRNGEGSTPIPVTEPFTDIGPFTLQHQYKVSNLFSMIPDAEGAVYRKIIPEQDVDITSFRYVDYHGSVGQQSSFPVLLDDTYNSMKTIGDGSWTIGNSDHTKIDGTHYVHEFTFTTPVHLTANTAYWFMVGGNMNKLGDEWLITYQTPTVTNDLLLVKNMYNVNQWMIPDSGEYQSSKPGMYLRLSDNNNKSWVI